MKETSLQNKGHEDEGEVSCVIATIPGPLFSRLIIVNIDYYVLIHSKVAITDHHLFFQRSHVPEQHRPDPTPTK